MREHDPSELADRHEHQADQLEHRGDQLQDEVESVRQDWERKRADPGVPGAPSREGQAEDADTSPGPEAPPEGAGPSGAETPPEGASGPPADADED